MRHDQPQPEELAPVTPIGHVEAARLVITTWARLVLATTAHTARGTCGPVPMARDELDALVEVLGETSEVELDEQGGEGTVSLTCPIDGYVVVLEIELVPGS